MEMIKDLKLLRHENAGKPCNKKSHQHQKKRTFHKQTVSVLALKEYGFISSLMVPSVSELTL
jgi:hypothetical protein